MLLYLWEVPHENHLRVMSHATHVFAILLMPDLCSFLTDTFFKEIVLGL